MFPGANLPENFRESRGKFADFAEDARHITMPKAAASRCWQSLCCCMLYSLRDRAPVARCRERACTYKQIDLR